jgi:hypothetical protein
MAPTFVLKIGAVDLSEYLRVNPDDHMDPYGAPWLEPAFTSTPYADGQPLVSTTVGNRESQWPLFLNEPSKDLLHALIRTINNAAGQRPLPLEWRDDGASKSTFGDIQFLRFEPQFDFRRSQYGYAAGVLHVWTSGYGHTGTTRVAGTAAGTGVFLSVPIPSVAGDAPALLDTTIHAGKVVPALGRIVALAPISHPSYAALIPAASLLETQAGASLIGASGAQGSQYLALPVSPTGGASGVACKVPLPNPTIAGGDNRILAVVKSGINSGLGITALDPYGNAMGATAVASNLGQWAVVDLGVCRLPTVGFPTQPEISIVAGALWASGAVGPVITGSPAGLALNEIICLPDKNLTLVLETAQRSNIGQDGFIGFRTLAGAVDEVGNSWSAALNNSHAVGGFLVGAGLAEWGGHLTTQPSQSATIAIFDADRQAGILSDSMRLNIKPQFASPALGFEELRLFKDVQASQYVQARLAASAFLSLEVATGADGQSGIVLASVRIATLSAGEKYRLSLQVQGPGAFVTLSKDNEGPVFAPASMAQASIGIASNAAIAGAGAPAVAMAIPSQTETADRPKAYSWEVVTLNAAALTPFDAYRFDGPDADVYRTASSGVFSGQKLMSVQRGAFPKAAPSTSSIAVVCAPFDQGVANDLVSAVVSVRERFFYAR